MRWEAWTLANPGSERSGPDLHMKKGGDGRKKSTGEEIGGTFEGLSLLDNKLFHSCTPHVLSHVITLDL